MQVGKYNCVICLWLPKLVEPMSLHLLLLTRIIKLCIVLIQDHLALMIELLGKMPRKVSTLIVSIYFLSGYSSISNACGFQIAIAGAQSKDFFDRHGDLKRIRRLKFCPLDRLLIDRYKFSENDAREFSEFLLPLLDFVPEKRPTAQQCQQHPWLNCKESTLNEMRNDSSVEKVNIGMSSLKIKVGK